MLVTMPLLHYQEVNTAFVVEESPSKEMLAILQEHV